MVDPGHRVDSGLGVDDRLQLARQAGAEGARLLWRDDAVLLAPLEVEVEPVEADPVKRKRPEPRPSAGAPPEPAVQAKATGSLGVYRPRRSSPDVMPILEPEPVDDEEDLPENVLEPLDE
jgi:hypothetical protein